MIASSPTLDIEPPASRHVPDMALDDLPPKVSGRISHLFRESLRRGQIHPLYLPMLRYRHEQWTEERRRTRSSG